MWRMHSKCALGVKCLCYGPGIGGRDPDDAGQGGEDRAGAAEDHEFPPAGSQQPGLPAPAAQCPPGQQPHV